MATTRWRIARSAFYALSYMATGGISRRLPFPHFLYRLFFSSRSVPQLPIFGLVRGFFYCDPDAALIGDNCRAHRHTNDLRGCLLVLLPKQHETPAAINQCVVLEAQHATPVTINKPVLFNVDVIVSVVAGSSLRTQMGAGRPYIRFNQKRFRSCA